MEDLVMVHMVLMLTHFLPWLGRQVNIFLPWMVKQEVHNFDLRPSFLGDL